MVFLELRRDSRVTTGNSGCLLCWPRQVQSSIRVAKESWGLLLSDCRANRPHLGLCPEANVPLQGRQGSRGCLPDAPGDNCIAWFLYTSILNPARNRRRDISHATVPFASFKRTLPARKGSDLFTPQRNSSSLCFEVAHAAVLLLSFG